RNTSKQSSLVGYSPHSLLARWGPVKYECAVLGFEAALGEGCNRSLRLGYGRQASGDAASACGGEADVQVHTGGYAGHRAGARVLPHDEVELPGGHGHVVLGEPHRTAVEVIAAEPGDVALIAVHERVVARLLDALAERA